MCAFLEIFIHIPIIFLYLAFINIFVQFLKLVSQSTNNNGHKNRGCIKYKSISTDYRSTVDDTSGYFKLYYSKRTESERYNSRFKNLNLENASVRSIASISNLNTLSHICLLTVAIIVTKRKIKIYSLLQLKRAS